MSTIDTSTWNPDSDFNTEIEGIPLNADADIAQTWKAIAILMAAMKGDTNAIKAMISVMEGATASADGTSGLVPQPLAGDQDKVLKGNGTWGTIDAGDVSIAWDDIENKPSSFTPSAHATSATTYGVSSASNYGHAMASSTTPKAHGTAAVGSETAKFARGDHVHPAQTSVSGNAGTASALASNFMIKLEGDVSGSTTTNGTGTATITAAVADDSHNHVISNVDGLQTALDGKAASSHSHAASDVTSGTFATARIPNLDASKITSGTIDIARLPAGALERLVTVTDQTARYALTTNDVQLGDTVKQSDTGVMYIVVDTSKLNSADGYSEYTAGSATSVPWSGVTSKPSSFTPSSHTHGSITNDGKLGTASRVVVTDGSKVIGVSSITTTKLGYLTDVTANIQSQIDSKATSGTTLADYGITDAKIASGVITLGSSTITPLTSSSSLNAAKLTGTASVNTTGKATTAGTADKVANKLTLKIKTGSTEGTDLYTFDGSGAKTLDIKQGSNITLTAASGTLTIAGVGDTKNTAGSTNSSSKLFLIGATSQAANPQTYSHDTAYVGTDGCLYSGGTKVLTAHQDISGKADKATTLAGYGITDAKIANGTITLGSNTITPIKTTDVVSISNGGTGGETREEAQNGILRPIIHTSGSFDFNDYILSSIHVFGATNTTLTNCPDGSNGLLMTFGATNAITKQFWSRYGTFDANDHYLGFRTGNGEGTWSSWHKLYTDSDTIPIANGGTGSVTRLGALRALTNEAVGTGANYFLTITTGWGKGGYTSVADAKTVLGLKSAAYTESSAYATSDHTHSYLPLSGGTMTGSITRNGNLAQSGSTSGSISIFNGTGASGGGGIWLYGKDNANAGTVRLQAYNGSYYKLDVNSDGTSVTNTVFTVSKSNSTVNKPAFLATGSGQNHILAAVDTSCKKGTTPTANKYWGISFYGEDYDNVNKRIGLIETSLLGNSNICRTSIVAYNCTTNTNSNTCCIRAIVDGSGNAYTEAPTPSAGDSSTKIATTAYVQGEISGFAADSDVVHKASNETISGTKTFSSSIVANVQVIIKRSTTGSITSFYGGTESTNGARLELYGGTRSTSPGSFAITATIDSSTNKQLLGKPDGTLTWSGSDITGDVHKTGNETIGGTKTFTSDIFVSKSNPSVTLKDTRQTRGTAPTSSDTSFSFSLQDSSGSTMSALQSMHRKSGQIESRIVGYNQSGSWSTVGIYYPASGSPYGVSPTPDSYDYNDTKIATTAWVTGKIADSAATSDERKKTCIEAISDAVLDAWAEVGFRQFKYREAVAVKGEAARLHVGVVAQRVIEAFKRHGLDASDYGLLCLVKQEQASHWEDRFDENGNVVESWEVVDREADEFWGIRYDEALALECALMRRRSDALEARIKAMEEKLNG